MKRIVLFLILAVMCMNEGMAKEPKETLVLFETTLGDIKVKLYNETPQHRDNIVKLVNEGFYNGVLFHRVIKEFMIQAGDPGSKECTPTTRLGAGDVGYNVPAEIVFPALYHKRGALAAARQADMVNPERKSSGCQFYIVEGKTFSDEELNMIERRIRQMTGDSGFRYTDEQRITYKTFGGTPHLDAQYTVFGEVVEGYDVITKIANVATGANDRPAEDVKIVNAKVVRH